MTNRTMIYNVVIITSGVIVVILLSFLMNFLDGYLILNGYQRSSSQWYIFSPAFITIMGFILLKCRGRFGRRLIFGVLYFIISLAFLITLKTISHRVQLHGFMVRAEKEIDLSVFRECAEEMAERCSAIQERVKEIELDIGELTVSKNLFLKKTLSKYPHLVLKKRLPYCYMALEFENYSISYMPNEFRILELQNSIQMERYFFSYSFRFNGSWRMKK